MSKSFCWLRERASTDPESLGRDWHWPAVSWAPCTLCRRTMEVCHFSSVSACWGRTALMNLQVQLCSMCICVLVLKGVFWLGLWGYASFGCSLLAGSFERLSFGSLSLHDAHDAKLTPLSNTCHPLAVVSGHPVSRVSGLRFWSGRLP